VKGCSCPRKPVLGFAATGQRHTDAELTDAAAEQVSVDAKVMKGVDYPAGPEFSAPSLGR
jgi:hypothetical protein